MYRMMMSRSLSDLENGNMIRALGISVDDASVLFESKESGYVQNNNVKGYFHGRPVFVGHYSVAVLSPQFME